MRLAQGRLEMIPMKGKISGYRWLYWAAVMALWTLLSCLPFSIAEKPRTAPPSPQGRNSVLSPNNPTGSAAGSIRFSIAPLTQSYVLVHRNPWSGYTRTFRFMYPAEWALQTNPPGVYGASPPGLDQSGLSIFVTPEPRGTTHFSFTQSPVIPGLVDMQSAIGQYLSQRLTGTTIVTRFALPPVVAGTAQAQTIFLSYRGSSGGVPVEGWLGLTLGTASIAGSYYSNIVVHEFQVALDLPQGLKYTYLNGLRGILTTLSGSLEQDSEDPARGFNKVLGGSTEARDPATGRTTNVPLHSRGCWISGNDVQCFEEPVGSPGPGWSPMEIAPAGAFPGK